MQHSVDQTFTLEWGGKNTFDLEITKWHLNGFKGHREHEEKHYLFRSRHKLNPLGDDVSEVLWKVGDNWMCELES